MDMPRQALVCACLNSEDFFSFAVDSESENRVTHHEV